MNRRQKKKYEKKGFEKSWYKSRLYHIRSSSYERLLMMNSSDGWEVTPFNYELEIIDSKRGNLKHPRRIIVKPKYWELVPACWKPVPNQPKTDVEIQQTGSVWASSIPSVYKHPCEYGSMLENPFLFGGENAHFDTRMTIPDAIPAFCISDNTRYDELGGRPKWIKWLRELL